MAETAPLQLWLTSRSAFETGVEHCARDRYLSYHAGPHGYGWARKAQSIPTLTGTLIHLPIAEILHRVQATDALPTSDQVYAAIQRGVAAYDKVIETRGLRLIIDEADLTFRRAEQVLLLEGLVWAWARTVLPAFHVEHRVLLVESEELSVIGCTCGLGDRIGTGPDHDARECQGIGWQTRGDVIVERREAPHTRSYWDFKTTGEASQNWEAQWLYRVQLVAGVLGAEQRLECEIDEVYIQALIKGPNKREWDPAQGAAVGPKYQNSPLVYGWRRPANPPLLPEDWVASYYFVGDDQKRHSLGKTYKRRLLSEFPAEIWQQNGCLSPLDYWTRWIEPTGLLAQQMKWVGPIYRKEWELQSFLTQLVGEERRWQQILWTLHDLTAAGHGWGSPQFMEALDRMVPMARGSACHNFYGDTCPNLHICNREAGWEDPALMGMIPRRPHHSWELEQAMSRGLLPESYGAEEWGED